MMFLINAEHVHYHTIVGQYRLSRVSESNVVSPSILTAHIYNYELEVALLRAQRSLLALLY